MREQYIHDPEVFRRHYQVGRGLTGFSGSRTQRGKGIGTILGAIARKALPLLKAGYKIAKPHLKSAAKGVAKDVTGRVTHAAANRLLGRMNGGQPAGVNKAKRKQKHTIKKKKRKRVTSKKDYLS